MQYNFLRFPDGKPKAFTFSYDDGCPDDVTFLTIVNRYHLKGTFNLIGNVVESESSLSQDFIRQNILGNGHEIANHGYEHRALNRVRSIDGIQDILDGRKVLEKTFSQIVRGMAFPDDVINRFQEPDAYRKIKKYLDELDIAYIRSAAGDNNSFELPEDWLNWIPTAHHMNPKLMDYIDEFIHLDVSQLYRAGRTPKLFYLWGHSYEFEQNHNWELLETICQKIANRSDIWYATGIEIYDYVQAYHSLIQSADGRRIYNPTLIPVWFDIDGTLYCVHSGETIVISQ